jgi:hypothetical protein
MEDISKVDEGSLQDLQEDGLCLRGLTLAEVWRAIARVLSSSPQLIEVYRGFNLITLRERWYAAPVGLAMNLERMRAVERKQLIKDNKLVAGKALEFVKRKIDALLRPPEELAGERTTK